MEENRLIAIVYTLSSLEAITIIVVSAFSSWWLLFLLLFVSPSLALKTIRNSKEALP